MQLKLHLHRVSRKADEPVFHVFWFCYKPGTHRHLLLIHFCGLGIKFYLYLCAVDLSLLPRSFFDITCSLKGFHVKDIFFLSAFIL